MQRLLGLATLFALLCCYAAAQVSLGDGSIQNNTYTNHYFRFTYTFPDGLTPQPVAAASPYRLLQLDSESSPEHISIVVEPALGISGVDALKTSVAKLQQQGFTNSSPETGVTYGGLPFRSATFRKTAESGTQYAAVAATLSHDYILEFFFSSAVEQRLATLVQSARTLEFQPDWTSGEPIDDSAPAGGPKRIRDSEGVQDGLLIRHDAPKYPAEARKKHIQGAVRMMIVIAKDGTPQCLYTLTGDPLLAPSALEAVSHWRYKPYLLNGNPVVVQSQVTINFVLQR